MRRLFPFFKWVWLSVVSTTLLAFGRSYLQDGTLRLNDSVKNWLTVPLHLGIVVSSIILLLIATWVSYYFHRKASRKQAFKLIKQVKKLKPQDLNNEFQLCKPGETVSTDKRPFYGGYVPRRFQPYHTQSESGGKYPENDTQLLEAVRQGQHVLLVGSPNQGKTRTAYELIKQLEGFIVVIPHSEKPTPSEELKLLEGHRVILFLDDLNYVGDAMPLDVVNFADEVSRQAQSMVIIATCRNGAELSQVTEFTSHRIKQLYERFSWVLALLDPTVEEKKMVAQRSGLPLSDQEVESAPTLGWVVMDEAYKKMYDRFQRLSIAEKETLWTLQLLSVAGGLPPTHVRIQRVRTYVFEADHRIRMIDILRTLTSEDFLRKPTTNNPVQARDAYLSLDTKKTVVPYFEGRAPKDDFKKLGEVLTQSKDEKALEALGITLITQYDDYDSALIYFKESHQIDPANARLSYNIGHIFSKQGKYEEAIKSYRKTVKYKPDHHVAWNNMGVAFAELGQHEREIECLETALSYQASYYDGWYNLGRAFSRQHKYEKAIDYYKEAVKYRIDFHEAWYNMGYAFGKLNRRKGMIESYREAMKYEPRGRGSYHQAWYNMGVTFQEQGEYQEAIECYQKAVKCKVDYKEAWYNMGSAFGNLDEHEEAIKCYEEVVKNDNNNCQAWYNMGYALFSLGNNQQAIEAIRRSVACDPTVLERLVLLGILLAQSLESDKDEAIKWLCKAWRVRSSLSEEQIEVVANTLRELGVDLATCDHR